MALCCTVDFVVPALNLDILNQVHSPTFAYPCIGRFQTGCLQVNLTNLALAEEDEVPSTTTSYTLKLNAQG